MVFWVGSCDWFLRVSAGMEREEEGRFSLLLPVFICVFCVPFFLWPSPSHQWCAPPGEARTLLLVGPCALLSPLRFSLSLPGGGDPIL